VAWIRVALIFVAAPGATANDRAFFCKDYGDILRAYLDGRGIVDYTSLEQNRGPLDAFVTKMASLDRSVYDKWTDKERVAFWINAYNALTLRTIIDHYPIKPIFLPSFRFPKDSIRQIPGVWDKLQFKIMGKEMTLDSMEHDTLRTNFNEPRIHMALVCAAMGRPPLRNEPYTGERLDSQLNDQTTRFLKNADKFRMDSTGGYVYLSSIFQWFGEDFIKTYRTDKFADRGATEKSVLNFVTGHLKGRDKDFIEFGNYQIVYLAYGWTLNDRSPDSGN